MRTSCLTLSVLLALVSVVDGAEPKRPDTITRLKDLHLRTPLVSGGKARAVLVVPAAERYAEAVGVIQAAFRRRAGLELPVRRDVRDPEKLLGATHVIALGNMSTNPFIEQMYRQWYVLLDLRYPGEGGHVVRSCHNPYGTGRNVIWVGGSDDAGVLSAARVFASKLLGGREVEVGWLMEIKLGEGIALPAVREGWQGYDRQVFSWRDGWRKIGEKKTGYGPSTYFGWNPISTAGALYYMTGRKEYLDYFKAMVRPDPKNIPAANRKDGGLFDPLHPLVKNYHYRAHLVDCVWDLIEESPLFTDEERLYVTNELLAHQNHYDPDDNFKGGSRHGMWHNICIYTGSRYFSKYYPAPRWEKRLGNVRRLFRDRFQSPGWGESDTLKWVSTSIEPYFEFFMLDGFDEFVETGTARTLMDALEVLWTGRKIEISTSCISISLMHKAAYMLKDGRYVWFLRQLGFDLDTFRVGQSFWPPDSLEVKPFTDRIGTVSRAALAKWDWYKAGRLFPHEQGFQMLCYRTGLGPKDDIVQIDGFHGGGRNPYHVNPVYYLRMDGQTLLSGFSNQLQVRCNGMVETTVAKAAALERHVSLGRASYVRTRVPNMPFSNWARHLLYVGGAYTFVLDELTAGKTGTFEVNADWRLQGWPDKGRREDRRVRTKDGAVLCCAQPIRLGESGHQAWSGDLQKGQALALNTLIYAEGKAKRSFTLEPLGEQANLVRGTHTAFIGAGPFRAGGFAVQARLAHVAPNRLFLVDATQLTCGGRVVLQADRPVSLAWDLASGALDVAAAEPCRLNVATGPGRVRSLEAGRHRFADVGPASGLSESIEQSLTKLGGAVVAEAGAPAKEKEAEPRADWQPRWTAELDGPVKAISPGAHSRPRRIWAITAAAAEDKKGMDRKDGRGAVFALSSRGKLERRLTFEASPLSLWAAADSAQGTVFAALVGFDDDKLRALDVQGRVLWERKAELPKVFRRGDRWEAPWFTDPQKKRGVLSILAGDFWGKGKQEIAIGRACAAEFYDLNGTFLERVPLRWGDFETLAVVRKRGERDGKALGPYVLAGPWWCGGPGVGGIDERHRLAGKGLFCMLPEDVTSMHGWMQRGLSHMAVADVDGNGVEEVIVVLSGHWNQVMVYDSGPHWHNCRWARYLGPSWPRSRFMRGLVVDDLNGDGNKEVVVAMQDGWVCAFDKDGGELWQRKLPAGARAMCALGQPARLAVGCSGGAVHLLDTRGRTRRMAKFDATVDVVKPLNGFLLAGTRGGHVALLDPKR